MCFQSERVRDKKNAIIHDLIIVNKSLYDDKENIKVHIKNVQILKSSFYSLDQKPS